MIIHYAISAESEGEKVLKICQHLPKLWAIKYGVVFMKHGKMFPWLKQVLKLSQYAHITMCAY